MSLKDRKDKRVAALQFAYVQERDNQGKVKSVLVPGTEGKLYKVILRRIANDPTRLNGIQTECLCQTGIGSIPCKGNGRHTICYHSQAAVMLAAQESGKVSWCEDREGAERLTHLNHGQIVPVTSRQGDGKAYIVFTRKAKK